MSEQTAARIPSTDLCVGLNESSASFPRNSSSSCNAAEGWLGRGERGRGLLSVGMDLLPHTQPAEGDPAVAVFASPGDRHICIRAARERRLGLLMELEIRSEVLDRQAVLQAEREREVMIACETVNEWWVEGRKAAVVEMTVCSENGISVKFKIFKVQYNYED